MVISFVFHLMMLMTATTESLEFDIGRFVDTHLLLYSCACAQTFTSVTVGMQQGDSETAVTIGRSLERSAGVHTVDSSLLPEHCNVPSFPFMFLHNYFIVLATYFTCCEDTSVKMCFLISRPNILTHSLLKPFDLAPVLQNDIGSLPNILAKILSPLSSFCVTLIRLMNSF
jgi:hypothetical protein